MSGDPGSFIDIKNSEADIDNSFINYYGSYQNE